LEEARSFSTLFIIRDKLLTALADRLIGSDLIYREINARGMLSLILDIPLAFYKQNYFDCRKLLF